jgi:hypothetical protein
MKKFTDAHMRACIQHCWDCRDTCQATLYNYCLAQGGHHVGQAHVRIMEDCIQVCQTAADFMTRGSELHMAVCAACADVCEACAESCEMMDDDEMNACAKVCRTCAASCREMSKAPGMHGGDRGAEDAAGLTPL